MTRHLVRMAGAVLAVAAMALAGAVAKASPLDGFADIVEKAKPAVVSITVAHPGSVRSPIQPQIDGAEPSLDDLLRLFLDPFNDDEHPSRGASRIVGSGFLIDQSGLVVTSAHVVSGGGRLTVTLSDDRRYPALLVGRDEETDLALLQVESLLPLPFVSWGNSDVARVGDWVIAIGNPFGLGGTVTAGIISARGRDIRNGRFDDYIQIDASINRGNSGGPSLNRDGEVIGVNSAIYSTDGGNLGIGFATPSTIARLVIEELRQRGEVRRSWLGIVSQEVTSDVAESLALPDVRGALVTSVVPASPAATAGLEQGDVVMAIGDTPVRQSRDLARIVAPMTPGRTVDLHVWRNGARLALPAQLQIAPDLDTRSILSLPRSKPKQAMTSVLGMSLAPINRETQQWFGLPEDARGALVVAPLEGAEIIAGDIIIRIGTRAVREPSDVVAGVKEARALGRGAVLLLVRRLNAERFIAVPLPLG